MTTRQRAAPVSYTHLKSLVTVRTDDRVIATNLRKFGAMLGDYVEIGCNSVLCPGAVIGRGTTVYPTSCVRGFVPEHSVYKRADRVVPKWEDVYKRQRPRSPAFPAFWRRSPFTPIWIISRRTMTRSC